ncbi:MAG TPA: hypothetical protein VJ205_00510, partial [Gammaproteobacteria bacterium]|nr:hypothetical protein [Gammaproteobacteria bacterium]
IAKSKKLIPYREIIESIIEQEGCCPKDIAAALAYLNQQSSGMPLHDLSAPPPPTPPQRENRRQR